MSNFTEQRRQQFLTEDYYQNTHNFYIEDIEFWKESDAFEDDQYNCGEKRRWNLITHDYLFLLYLEYTAGQAIEEMIPWFEKVIEGYENQAEALAIFHNSNKPSIITEIGQMLSIIGLAYLLDRKDLLPRIITLINGENGGRLIEDAITSRFLRFNDPKHPIIAVGDEALYNPAYHLDWCTVIDNVNDDENKKNAITYLDAYLSDWYQMNKHELWHNSHLEPAEELRYSGYWAFEAAALVYLLDLDDSALHKYLFYPKDIVQWARSQKTSHEPSLDTQQYSIAAGEICPRSGYWFTVAKENSRQYFNEGDVFPDFKNSWGVVYWQFSGEE